MRKQTKLVAVLSAAALLAIGASMTSFAATRGWVQEGEDWVYLDNDGERVFNQWKRSGDFYYYLGEDGVMVTDQLVHDDTLDAYYYVNENGVRLMNSWKSIPNDEGVQVGDNTPEILYYYFGAAGKATRATNTGTKDLKTTTIDGKVYAFDTEGRMASGWQWIDISGTDELYFFGPDTEGWARTGWQQLEPGENERLDNYDDLEWYYFNTNGRAVRDTSKNINGKYYAFDENGVMRSDWYDISTAPEAASDGIAFASSNGTLASGWVYTNPKDDSDADDQWFYLVTLRDGKNVKRSVPFNYFGTNHADADDMGVKAVRAKVIKNKTYIFDTDGQMLTGFVVLDAPGLNPEMVALADEKEGSSGAIQKYDLATEFTEDVYGAPVNDLTNGIKARELEAGLYYFNEAGGSVNGQLMTGRTAVTKDGETFYYYFNKTGNSNNATNYGKALVSAVKDGYLYGRDGRCLTADDGNSYAIYRVSDVATNGVITINPGANAKTITTDAPDNSAVTTAYIVVSKTGRIKQSGTATIDGVKYTISNYKVTDSKVID